MKDKVKKLSEGYSVDLVRNKNFFIDAYNYKKGSIRLRQSVIEEGRFK